MRSGNKIFLVLFLLMAAVRPVQAESSAFCEKLRAVWGSVENYRCTYDAKTFHEGKFSENVMEYLFKKPGKIRMNIRRPRPGAVLIYNPQKSALVQVRPFPSLKFLVLKFKLTDPKVSADGGGTVDQSDLGHRTETLCTLIENGGALYSEDEKVVTIPVQENGKPRLKKFTLNGENLIAKIELTDLQGKVLESFSWDNLVVNGKIDDASFTEF